MSFAQDNTIPTTGNVGLGTLTPSARLDVNGNMKVDSCLHVKDSLLIEDNARIMSDMRVEGETTLLGDTKIDGTLFLSNVLEENNPNQFQMLVIKSDGSVAKSGINPFGNDTDDSCEPGSVDRTAPSWLNGFDKLYTYCPEVKVGIGFHNPRVNLDVIGRGYLQRLYLGTADPTVNDNNLYYHLKVPFTSNIPDRTIFKIENADRSLFEVKNSGLVRAREIKIDALVWADYVFKPDYQLMPLSEVENYINQNGHLPNVPTEKEVLEEGINVGEMNKILLEKIEELTLHIIEQEKRIVELEKQ